MHMFGTIRQLLKRTSGIVEYDDNLKMYVDAFNDPMIDNKDSKKRYRADVLVEDYVAKLDAKIEKEVKKAAKRFGDAFNKEEFVSTNQRVLGYQEKIAKSLQVYYNSG